MLPLPPSPPPSPSKRRSTECHYSDSELSSPSKKRAPSRLEGLDFEGRGLLFTDSTNIRAPGSKASRENEDVFLEGANSNGKGPQKDVAEQQEKERPSRAVRTLRTVKPQISRRHLMKVEVVLDPRPACGKGGKAERPRPASRTAIVR